MRRRYRQIQQSDGSFKLVEITNEQAPLSDSGQVYVQPDLNFKSIVDGSIITTHAQLQEHNKRNNVVHQSEFGTEAERKSFYDRKARERADFFNGTAHTHYGKRLKRERIADIVDAIKRHE